MSTQPRSAQDVLAAAEAALDADPDFTGGAADVATPPAADPAAGSPPDESKPAVEAKPEQKQPAESPSEPATTGTPTVPTYSPSQLNMLKKFGGDGLGGDADRQAAQKAADHYWETQSQNARLAEQAKRPEPEAGSPPAPTGPQFPTEVTARFDHRMRVLADEFDGNLETLNTLRREKVTVTKELRSTDPYDHEKRSKAADRLLAIDDEIDAIGRQNVGLKERYDDQKTLKEQAVSTYALSVETQRAREAENKARDDARKEKFWAVWDPTLTDAAKDLPEELKADFVEFAETEAFKTLERMQAAGDPSGIRPAEAIGKAKEKFLRSHDLYHRLKTTTYSKDKIGDAKINAPKGAAAVAPETKSRKFASRDELEAHLEAIEL